MSCAGDYPEPYATSSTYTMTSKENPSGIWNAGRVFITASINH